MTGGQRTAGRTQAARRDFEAALERLLDGKPTNKRLRELAGAKKLRITIAAVALEAGRSRTLIGSDDCRFPDVRARIIEASREPDQPVTTVTRLANSLRATNAELRAEVKALRSQQALMLARMIEAEREAKIAREALEGAGEEAPDGANVHRLPHRPRSGSAGRRRQNP